MNQRFKVLFFLKRGKGCNQKPLPLYVRVKVDDTAAEWSVQRRLDTGSKWNQKLGRVTGTKEESRTLNSYLDAIQGNIFNIQRECALRNECTSADELRARVLGRKGEKLHTLIEVSHTTTNNSNNWLERSFQMAPTRNLNPRFCHCETLSSGNFQIKTFPSVLLITTSLLIMNSI
jgi:hypothetical protein